MGRDLETPPNWQKLSTLSLEVYSLFSAEQWEETMRQCYEIVMDDNTNNQEIVSRFLSVCDNSPSTKRSWTDWLMIFCADREDGPIRPEEVMRYLHHLSMEHETQVKRLRKHRQAAI